MIIRVSSGLIHSKRQREMHVQRRWVLRWQNGWRRWKMMSLHGRSSVPRNNTATTCPCKKILLLACSCPCNCMCRKCLIVLILLGIKALRMSYLVADSTWFFEVVLSLYRELSFLQYYFVLTIFRTWQQSIIILNIVSLQEQSQIKPFFVVLFDNNNK